jgi:hypothetical protein
VCVESADGSWLVQEGVGGDGAPPRLVWRLEYPRQRVRASLCLGWTLVLTLFT